MLQFLCGLYYLKNRVKGFRLYMTLIISDEQTGRNQTYTDRYTIIFTGKCLLIEWMGKPSRLRNDVEGCVWPFRWQLSSAAAGMASRLGQSMHGGQELQKVAAAVATIGGKAGRQRLNRVWP